MKCIFEEDIKQINNFEELEEQIKRCRICKNLFSPNPLVFGNKDAKIVQIGQAPSQNASETNTFFNDESGKRLRNEWYEITDEEFYNPDNFYILPLAHCFPGKNKYGHDNNPPKICFEKWGKNELNLIDNEIYIILGAKAAKKIFPDKKFEELVFTDSIYNGKKTYVLPHPSPLNNRWLKKHPEFIQKRMPEIRKEIKKVLK